VNRRRTSIRQFSRLPLALIRARELNAALGFTCNGPEARSMRPDEEDERRASLVGKGAPRGDALRPFRNYCFQFRRIIRVYVQRT
jgi:hypothetical protein